MALQVVKSEEQVNLVVLEHRERALDRLPAALEVHVGSVYSSQNLRLTHADGHTCKPRVKLVQQVALLGALLADDCALGSAVYEGLDWVSVDSRVDVQHGDVAEKLWVVLHGLLILCADHLLPNLLFDHFLSFDVVRVRVPHLHLALLLSLLPLHDFLESVCHDFLDLLIVIRVECGEKLGVTPLQPRLEVSIRGEQLLDLVHFHLDSHILGIMGHLVQQLLLSEAGPSLLRTWLGCKERIHQVLLVGVQDGDTHVDHVVVDDPDFIELARVLRQHRLAEKQLLLLDLDLRLDVD